MENVATSAFLSSLKMDVQTTAKLFLFNRALILRSLFASFSSLAIELPMSAMIRILQPEIKKEA
jgi:hypothetical protein